MNCDAVASSGAGATTGATPCGPFSGIFLFRKMNRKYNRGIQSESGVILFTLMSLCAPQSWVVGRTVEPQCAAVRLTGEKETALIVAGFARYASSAVIPCRANPKNQPGEPMIRPALAALLSALVLAVSPAQATINFTKPTTFIAFEPESAGSLVRFDPYFGPPVSSASLTFRGFVTQNIAGFIPPFDPIPTAITFNPQVFIRAGVVFQRFDQPGISIPVTVQADRSFSLREQFEFTTMMDLRLQDALDGLEIEYGVVTLANELPRGMPSQRSLLGQLTVSFTEAAQSVPEPASVALLGVGMVALWGWRGRQGPR